MNIRDIFARSSFRESGAVGEYFSTYMYIKNYLKFSLNSKNMNIGQNLTVVALQYTVCSICNFGQLFVKRPKPVQGATMASYRRQCYVMTSSRRWYDFVCPLGRIHDVTCHAKFATAVSLHPKNNETSPWLLDHVYDFFRDAVL